ITSHFGDVEDLPEYYRALERRDIFMGTEDDAFASRWTDILAIISHLLFFRSHQDLADCHLLAHRSMTFLKWIEQFPKSWWEKPPAPMPGYKGVKPKATHRDFVMWIFEASRNLLLYDPSIAQPKRPNLEVLASPAWKAGRTSFFNVWIGKTLPKNTPEWI